MKQTLPLLQQVVFPPLTRATLQTLQVNLGYRCNQQCLHCHVNASPYRQEVMNTEVMAQVMDFIKRHAKRLKLLDITGGAPELNPGFRDLVLCARSHGIAVMDRCNLTILQEANQQDLADFLAENQVEITASLPCYAKENVDAQRGAGVFDKSVLALKRLNELGYGRSPELILNLVYNPQGAVLPPEQSSLERDYKQKLKQQWNIEFNHLFTLANMPIKRFGSMLLSKDLFDDYLQLLKKNHLNENMKTVMCRSLISVDWQGYIYDCDFNQILDLPILDQQQQKIHISRLNVGPLSGQSIRVAGHCYACTAGQGSSCGGALQET